VAPNDFEVAPNDLQTISIDFQTICKRLKNELQVPPTSVAFSAAFCELFQSCTEMTDLFEDSDAEETSQNNFWPGGPGHLKTTCPPPLLSVLFAFFLALPWVHQRIGLQS
jgi:hypothetical protein